VREAGADVATRAGSADPAKRTWALDARTTDRATTFAFKGKVTTWPVSEITGGPVAHYTDAPWDSLVPLYRDMQATLTVTLPRGYLIPQEWTRAADLLRVHGLRFRRLAKAYGDTVEVPHVTAYKQDADAFEGHHVTHVTGVENQRRWRTFRPGDIWVPLDQPSAALVVNLCEAQAPDGFVAWNVFDTVFQLKEYGEDYVIEPLAKKMLAADPKLAAEFASRLASDPAFAANPRARSDFFYRRSPWADPEQNLVPVARALRAVPEAFLAPADTPAASPAGH
jgi:hypothetical protein